MTPLHRIWATPLRTTATLVIGFGNAETEAQPCPAPLQYTALFGTAAETAPETYYRESLLLFHVLGVLASRNWRRAELLHALNHTTFNTPMGEVSFDCGERRAHLTPSGGLALKGC